jgi:hypothetical protein
MILACFDFLFTIKDLLVQIISVGDVIRVENVVLIVLNTLFISYKNFVQGVSTQETLPSFDKLMSKFLQEAQRSELRGDQTTTEKKCCC